MARRTREVTLRGLVALALALVGGCEPDWTCKPGPWTEETWSSAPLVTAQLRDGCGFPDTPTDYRVFANGKLIIDDSLEHFGRRHAITKLPDGRVEVAIWDRSCTVSASGAKCTTIDYKRWDF